MQKTDLEKHRQERHQLTDPVTEERHRVGGGLKAKETPPAVVSKLPKNQPNLTRTQGPQSFFTCPICSSTYHSERALNKHIGVDHKKKTAPNGGGSSSAPVTTTSSRRGRHVCEFCGKNWARAVTLEIHRQILDLKNPHFSPATFGQKLVSCFYTNPV